MMIKDIESLSDAEKLALVQAVQESVAANKAKQTTQEVGQYAKLVVDAIKKIKVDLEERYAEINANITVKAAAIKDGKDGQQGPKGEKGDRGFDGANGRDGANGKDGKDGLDGHDGVSVTDARIDFDGSLVIGLSNGREINAGEVVPMDMAEKIKVVANGGGTSQYVLDLISSLQSQIDAIHGGLTYKGAWNASTNTPSLASGTGTSNWYYVVSVAGSTNLDGITDWQVGDWAIYNGTAWQKIDQTNSVTSVAGRTGAVTLSTSDISGLGTIATQAANSVTITGGTINSTSIGATTPSTAAFTTLSANAVTSTTPVLSFNASNSIATFGSTTANSYNQLVIQNKSATTGASTNYVLSNNLGTDSTYYGEFGMNASTYSSGTPADFFSFNNGVYFSSHDGDVTVGSGNGYKTYLAWGTSGDKAHVVNASGAIGLNTNITGTSNFGTSGQVLTSAGSAATPTWTTPTTGTVTSVGGTGTVSGLTLTGTVTTSGNLTLGGTLAVTPSNFASQTANTVLAAPNGASGTPTFRTLVAADVPTLNQNTTGSAGSVVTTGFSIVESGGKLVFKYGATAIASMDSTGVFTTLSNHVANGTP
jgi:Collagen triple helix repeat (20 copies)